MGEIAKLGQELFGVDRQLIKGFRWRPNRGGLLAPQEMATSHLFYTLRMIWNHHMPEEAKLHPFHQYRFGKHYTEQYMKRAVFAIGYELCTRADIHPDYEEQLMRMINYLRQKRIGVTK